ncbi:MAG: hypothetical protein CL733_00070 [Chloroflexi bacterium]|nr:hypothetical protein [Chloroflexota bacterium]
MIYFTVPDCPKSHKKLSDNIKYKPIGKVKWYWLIIISLVGSLLFALPFYYWLNKRNNLNN